MTTIIILPDFEKGHVFPSFKIAKNLEDVGYDVCYVGIPDVIKFVEKQGFNCQTICSEMYPEGYLKELENGRLTELNSNPKHIIPLIQGDIFDDIVKKLQPKLIISTITLSLETLILYYKYKIPQILYNYWLPELSQTEETTLTSNPSIICIEQIMNLSGERCQILLEFIKANNIAFKSLVDLVSPLEKTPQFLLCPRELHMRDYALRKKDIFVGPCIREPTIETEEIQIKYLPKNRNKKVVLVSPGSQISAYSERVIKLYKLLIKCAKQLPNYHFIFSIGQVISLSDIGEISTNVSVFKWVPQVELLQHVSLAIIHGGWGSVKECIYYGVPMLVIPMGRDQFDTAERIKTYNLGLCGDLTSLSVEMILSMINHLINNDIFQTKIDHMQGVFQEREKSKEDVKFVRKYIGDPV